MLPTDGRFTVDPSGLERFRAVLIGSAARGPSLATICRNIVSWLPVSGASVALMSPGSMQGFASATDSVTKVIQDLEFTVGEGPGVDAFSRAKIVLVDDLECFSAHWPLFVPAALALGVRSVCSLPLCSGSMSVGVLNLWSDQPTTLVGTWLQEAHLVAEIVTQMILTLQYESTSESLAWSLEISDHRTVVHQATGMISAQLDCDVDEALVRLRAHAFSVGQQIDDVAKRVIRRQLRFG